MKLALAPLLKGLWQHPLVKGLEVDAENAITVHRRMIEAKPLLKQHYIRWYRECLPAYEATRHLGGALVEIGSGAGFLEEFIPDLVKTDVVPSPYTSRVVDATQMDFRDGSLRALFLIGVLHHIPDPAAFLREAVRCLQPGGRLVVIEPTNNAFQRFLASRLDHYEYYDDAISEWTNGAGGRMTRANLALSWVIFFRDRERFSREFPLLELAEVRYHTFLSYILSGGMTYRSFVPFFAAPIVDVVEALPRPVMRRLATAMTLELIKA